MGKSYVIATHLWLEHILVRTLTERLPVPQALFKSRNLSFVFLVSLCEAHEIISERLANMLRLFNSFRNKCAHLGTFEPSNSPELVTLQNAIRAIKADYADISIRTSQDTHEDGFEHVCEGLASMLERRAEAIGVTDLDADLVVAPNDWEREYYNDEGHE
jgi:hypothetical protein